MLNKDLNIEERIRHHLDIFQITEKLIFPQKLTIE